MGQTLLEKLANEQPDFVSGRVLHSLLNTELYVFDSLALKKLITFLSVGPGYDKVAFAMTHLNWSLTLRSNVYFVPRKVSTIYSTITENPAKRSQRAVKFEVRG
jgi:hypothetical protein